MIQIPPNNSSERSLGVLTKQIYRVEHCLQVSLYSEQVFERGQKAVLVPLDVVACSMMNRQVWALTARNGDAGRVVEMKRERL